MRHTRFTGLALVVATLGIYGCGESSKTLTRSELTAKANAICKRVNEELAATNKTVSNLHQIAIVAPKLATVEQSALTELSKLTPPSELANDWKQIIAGAQSITEVTVKLGTYAKTNNTKGVQSLFATGHSVQQQMVATAKRDGFTECERIT